MHFGYCRCVTRRCTQNRLVVTLSVFQTIPLTHHNTQPRFPYNLSKDAAKVLTVTGNTPRWRAPTIRLGVYAGKIKSYAQEFASRTKSCRRVFYIHQKFDTTHTIRGHQAFGDTVPSMDHRAFQQLNIFERFPSPGSGYNINRSWQFSIGVPIVGK